MAEVSGRIRKLNLTEGALVNRGDILIQLDSREIEIREREIESSIHAVEQRLSELEARIDDTASIDEQLEAADLVESEAGKHASQVNLDQAQFRFRRASELFSAGLISRQTLDESHVSLSQAKLEQLRASARSPSIKSAQNRARLRELAAGAVPMRAELVALYAQLEQARLGHDRLSITSPCDGELAVVTPLHVNEILVAGKPIAFIVPEHYSMVVEAWLSASDRPFVSVGQNVRLQSDSVPQDEYDRIDGRVDYISPDAMFDDSHGLYRVVISVDTPPVPLHLGMTFRAYFVTREEPLLWLLYQKVKRELTAEAPANRRPAVPKL
jgi:multidrug resistance efflux pump